MTDVPFSPEDMRFLHDHNIAFYLPSDDLFHTYCRRMGVPAPEHPSSRVFMLQYWERSGLRALFAAVFAVPLGLFLLALPQVLSSSDFKLWMAPLGLLVCLVNGWGIHLCLFRKNRLVFTEDELWIGAPHLFLIFRWVIQHVAYKDIEFLGIREEIRRYPGSLPLRFQMSALCAVDGMGLPYQILGLDLPPKVLEWTKNQILSRMPLSGKARQRDEAAAGALSS